MARGLVVVGCHLTLQDHVIKRFCDFIEGSPSLYRTNMPSLVAVVTDSEDNIFNLSGELARWWP